METTDNHTPTPEELTLCIEESAVRAADACEQSPAVLWVDGSVIGTLGNFSASIGKAKSKKTFNVAALTAAAMTNGTVLHYRASFPEGKRGILYIDTEQGRPHCQQVLRRILRLARAAFGDAAADADILRAMAALTRCLFRRPAALPDHVALGSSAQALHWPPDAAGSLWGEEIDALRRELT